MTRRVRLRPKARSDLDEIWDYTVSTWSRAQAVTYLTGLDSALQMLAAHPETVRLRQEFSPPVRIYSYRSHLVIFTANDEQIDILRVVHGRKNWAAFLME